MVATVLVHYETWYIMKLGTSKRSTTDTHCILAIIHILQSALASLFPESLSKEASSILHKKFGFQMYI